MESGSAIFCQRCSVELMPGRGDFYVVRVEAFADPSPPRISAEELEQDPAESMQEIIAQMRELSPQEAMDSVYRRLSFYLCRRCYREWIEKPA